MEILFALLEPFGELLLELVAKLLFSIGSSFYEAAKTSFGW
jgi:hypothetical protein